MSTTKRFVFLNSPILTSEGEFSYYEVEPSVVQGLLKRAPDIPRLSAIGHASTAQALSLALGEEVKENRITYTQEMDDLAIVFKLNGRAPESKILSIEEITAIGFSFYFLRKLEA